MEKYDIISVVGEGSYGLVMRCRHRESGQYVAIKKFLETEDDPTVRKMALREIRMLKKLRHENLVNMIEVFRRKKRFFLVFEYLEHTVLEELEARSGGLGYITSRKYIYQVLRALDFIHSHDVIHRDIKPENVLVSRLGVIKLCDFGFARLYSENETFTDYVATRWYRSPELLVGDRYGKEVDIWAVGCLYSEMMTGEPLFPGESDIDQLFQIVRILGKLSSRHQILIMRNAMFRGMKQEQNTSLIQMFPNWNRDSIDFLSQCLKMDSNARPDTMKLLKHELFSRDNFLDNFLSELRAKLAQEMQVNPLLKRIPSYGSNNRWNTDEKKMHNNNDGTNASIKSTTSNKKSSGDEKKDTKMANKINLTVLSTQLLQPANSIKLTNTSTNANGQNNKSNFDSSSDKVNVNDDLTNGSTINREVDELNKANLIATVKQRTIGNANGGGGGGGVGSGSNTTNHVDDNNQLANGNDMANKQNTTVNNPTFKDTNKYSRVLSAKLQKSNGFTMNDKTQSTITTNNVNTHNSTNSQTSNVHQHHLDLQFEPPSPIPFQSLQTDSTLPATELTTLLQNKRLSPVSHIISTNSTNSNNNNSFLLGGQHLPQYFNFRRHSNVLGANDQITLPKGNQFNAKTIGQTSNSQTIPFNSRTGAGGGGGGAAAHVKRDRSQNLIDATLKPLNNTGFNSLLTSNPNDNAPAQNSISTTTLSSTVTTKETSPRILPPPQWLTGNLKLTGHGKNAQIGNSINANGNSKRRITDWKSIGMTNSMGPVQQKQHNDGNNDFVLPNCPGATISPKKSNQNSLKKKLSSLSNIYQEPNHTLITPRNFSASSDHINET